MVQLAMKDAFRVEGVVCRFENQSLILSPQQHDQILLWLQESSGAKQVKQELLYRASHDGWQGQDFHSRCDANGATVTVSSARAVSSLAATLTPPWNASGGYSQSPKAFFISLHSPSGVGSVKLPLVQNRQYAIIGHPSYGPTFGGGHDLPHDVANCANSNTSSHTNLGHAYQLPPGQSAGTFFTEGQNFQAAEVEAYQVMLSDIQDCLSVRAAREL